MVKLLFENLRFDMGLKFKYSSLPSEEYQQRHQQQE